MMAAEFEKNAAKRQRNGGIMAGNEKTDIVPELLEQIKKDFDESFAADPLLRTLSDKISSGKASYVDAEEFAARTGELLAAALQKNITAEQLPNGKMYYNIAERILGTMLRADHAIISGMAAEVQASLNERASLGLKPQTADFDTENAQSIIDKVSAADDFSTRSWMLDAPVETFSMKVVDDTIKKNADFHYKAGLKPRIVRSAETKCCDWCASLDGTYEYPGVPKEVFARHNNCRCTVNYDPRNGKVQNVWNKKEWKDSEEYDKIEARKNIQPEEDRDNQKIIERKNKQGYSEKTTKDIRIASSKMSLGLRSSTGLSETRREELGAIDISNIDQAISYFSDQIRNMPTEHAIVIETDGTVTHFISNTNIEVDIFDVKNLKGAHVLHNHPDSTSFGKSDFNFMRANQESIYEVCSPKYDYRLEIKKDISNLSYTTVYDWPEYATDSDWKHLTMEALAKKGYVDYDRKRKGN